MRSSLVLAAGLYNLAFAVFHLLFWRLFRWRQQLAKLSFANAGIMQVLNLCLTYVFVLAAALCLAFPVELCGSELGRFLLLAMAVFWLARTVYQPLFFRLAHPLSLALFIVFVAGTALHGVAWWQSRAG